MSACYQPLIEIRSFEFAHSGLICSNHCNRSSERNEVTHLLWPCKIAIKFLHVKWLNDPILVKAGPQYSTTTLKWCNPRHWVGRNDFHVPQMWTWWANPSVHGNSGRFETSTCILLFHLLFLDHSLNNGVLQNTTSVN